MPCRLMLLALTWSLLAGFASSTTGAPPTPPTQPETGPGGSTYQFETVHAAHFGSVPTGYWQFWPERDGAKSPLPIVVFLHGFSAVNPETYRAWLDHIVRRGAVVVYPDYQTERLIETQSTEFEPNAIAGVKAALASLADGSAGLVDPSRIAFVGHSLGAVLALNIAARAEQLGLTMPGAVMAVEPGGCAECGGISRLLGLPYADLSTLGQASRAIIMVGDEDQVVSDQGAKVAWERMRNVPLEQRDYVVLHSDHTGRPALIADHYAPLASGTDDTVDTLDWYGTWKFFDLLTDCTFLTLNCTDALNGSVAAYNMGRWSDGRSVAQPTITDTP